MMRMNICIALTMALAGFASAEPMEPPTQADPTQFFIEQQLKVEVYSASKFMQKIFEVSAAVTIITAANIQRHGNRALADILASMPDLTRA